MHFVSPEFEAALGEEATEFCGLWTITRRDGFVIRLTDHDTDVVFGGERYRADVGFTASATSISANANQSVELDVAMSDQGIKELDVRGRLYDGADCVLQRFNYKNVEAGTMTLFNGRFGRIKFTEFGHCTIEVMSLGAIDAPIANEVYSQSCRNHLGDTLCRVAIEQLAVNITVVEVLNKQDFIVNTFGGRPTDYFALGQLKWNSGANATIPVDIRTNNSSTMMLGMFYPLGTEVAVGDTGRLYPGCNKQWSVCGSKFGNQLNFRGEPLVSNFMV